MGEVIKATYGDYSGVLYGVGSMAIYDKDGNEVMHTGCRTESIRTKDDLIEFLKEYPKFRAMLMQHWKDIQNDDSEEDDI